MSRKTSPTRRRVVAGALATIPALVALGVLAGATPRQALASTQLLPTPPPLPCPSLPPLPPYCPTLTPLPTAIPTPPPLPSIVPTSVPTLPSSLLPGPTTPGNPFSGGVPPGLPGSSQLPGQGGQPPGGATGGFGFGSTTPGLPGSSQLPGQGGQPPGGATGGFGFGSTTPGSPAALNALTATTPYLPVQVSGELVMSDPFLAWQVEQVLQHPLSTQHPDLAHFSLQSASQPLPPGGISGLLRSGGPALLAGATALVLLLGLATMLRVGRRSARLRVVVGLATLAVVAPLAAVAVNAASIAQLSPPSTQAVAQPVAVAALNADNILRARALSTPQAQPAPPPPQQSQAWTTLVGIESAIANDQQQLSQTEGAIAAYNALLQSQSPATPAPAAQAPLVAPAAPAAPAGSVPAIAGNLLGLPPLALPSAPMLLPPAPARSATAPSSSAATAAQAPTQATVLSVVTGRLASLMSAHNSLATQYSNDLQNEYDFFAAVVRSPAQQSDILHAAAQASPSAVTAITYDIGLVYTQLAQEAAISAAEAGAPSGAAHAGWTSFVPPSGPITFRAPVGGTVTQGFGPTPFTLEPPMRYNGVFYPHFHTGLDIASPLGTPVGAAASGIVILATASRNAAGYYTGYGNYVVIEHGDGFVTLYGHLERLLVTTGQTVQQGQAIGLLGSTGWSTGPHVHFEVRDDGVFVNPAPYIASQLAR